MDTPANDEEYDMRLSVVLNVPEHLGRKLEALATGIVFNGPQDGLPFVALKVRGEEAIVPIVLGRAAAAAFGAALIAAAGVVANGTQELPIDD